MKFKQLFTRENISDYLLIAAGSIIQAIGMTTFLIPANLIGGGISGLAQILNHFYGWPIGVMTLIGNIPLFMIGWRYLGKFRFVLRTIFSVVAFSLLTDLFSILIPNPKITNDIFLNTMFGAVVMGIGYGLVYRGSGTSGGTDILVRVLNQRLGISITTSYLITDSLIILAGGLVFGWNLALYALIVNYVSGVAANMVSEGSSGFREAIIITDKPHEIADAIMMELNHGVTLLNCTGAYSKKEKGFVYCVIYRNEVNQLKKIVVQADPGSFMVVGQTNEVLGEGFLKYKILP